jgi:TPR repeat protein
MRAAAAVALGLSLACGGAQAQDNFIDQMRMSNEGLAAQQVADAVAYINGGGGFPRDGRKGCDLARKASRYRPDAERIVGRCYHFGLGGEQDDAKAMRAYERAYARGDREAACPLARLLVAHGRDLARAATLRPKP